jgi:hypothetical protein
MRHTHRPLVHAPLETADEVLDEPAPFPTPSTTAPVETVFPDWRPRLTRNLSRRSDGRWEPLSLVHRVSE